MCNYWMWQTSLIYQQNTVAMYFLPLIFYPYSKTLNNHFMNDHGMIFLELYQAMFPTPCIHHVT